MSRDICPGSFNVSVEVSPSLVRHERIPGLPRQLRSGTSCESRGAPRSGGQAVAPVNPVPELGEVVVGAADAHREQRGSERAQLRAHPLRAALPAYGDLDVREVAADVGAVLAQDGDL